MNCKIFLLAIILLGYSCGIVQNKINYPNTKKVDQVDDYYGTRVEDPYRWLENDTADEVGVWVEQQNKVTFDYLDKIKFRGSIKDRLTEIWNYPKYSAPFKEGEYYFFYKNDGLQNQSVLYIQSGLNGKPEVFLDPNKLSEDGTVALTNFSVSHDQKYVAYGTSGAGSDWKEFHVIEMSSRKELSDKISWVKFSGISWYKDGFYYSRYDAPKEGVEYSSKNEFHKVYYHKVGTGQDEDVLIYSDKDKPQRNFYAQTTEDENYLLIYVSEATSGNMLFIKDLTSPDGEFITIVDDFENDHSLVDNMGSKLFLITNKDAPKKRLVSFDANDVGMDKWVDILSEKEEVLRSAGIIGGKIVATYMKDASSKAYSYDIKGKFEKEIILPGIGTVGGFSGKKDDETAFYTYTSFTFPTTIYKYNTRTFKSEIFRKSEVEFTPGDFITKQVWYKTKDGTDIPMFIVHKKGLKMDGNNPTLLYGYGGFDISINPSFSISRLVFLENGGIYAVATLRGGGEYGEEWHEAGKRLKKQNVFDDFISAAEYLIAEKYTSSEKLAISGRSNGGLLVGACMTQRPELYKVALPGVGVMDMLRFHKFTIGWAWVGEYGSSEESKEDFENLYGFSPVHNLKAGVNYPATMVTTADHDDRVVPAHSFKFIATLQEHHTGNAPVLIRIDTKAGHGSGKPTSKRIEEAADIWAFVFYNLGVMPVYE